MLLGCNRVIFRLDRVGWVTCDRLGRIEWVTCDRLGRIEWVTCDRLGRVGWATADSLCYKNSNIFGLSIFNGHQAV